MKMVSRTVISAALCLGLAAAALPGAAAQDQKSSTDQGQAADKSPGMQLASAPPPPGISPTTPFISATCFTGPPNNCPIVITNQNDTAIKAFFNLSATAQIVLYCQDKTGEVTGGFTLMIPPGFGGVGMSCPTSDNQNGNNPAVAMYMSCKPGPPCTLGWVP